MHTFRILVASMALRRGRRCVCMYINVGYISPYSYVTFMYIGGCRRAGQPGSQSAGQAANQPTSRPASQPASQSAGQPDRQPASQPASQTASQPASLSFATFFYHVYGGNKM